MTTMLVDRVERPLSKGVTVRVFGRAWSASAAKPRRVARVGRAEEALAGLDGSTPAAA